MMSDKSLLNVSFVVNIILVLILLVVINNKRVVEVPIPDKILIDKVARVEKENLALIKSVNELKATIETIQSRKQQVKIIYREKVKFIKSANSDQLDSLIRANW
jgi:ABC-type Na+ efflux pump permease subunit